MWPLTPLLFFRFEPRVSHRLDKPFATDTPSGSPFPILSLGVRVTLIPVYVFSGL